MWKRIITLFLVLTTLLAVTPSGRSTWQAAFVIPNLLPNNKIRPLEWLTAKPKIKQVSIPFAGAALPADLYLPKNPKKTLLAIHGANEKGKDDPRIINFGQTYARAGFAVLVPTFPNITRERFTPEAVLEIKTAFLWLAEQYPDQPAGMVAFSVAGGPMFLAAAEEELRGKVDYLISFGGYYELKAVLKNITTNPERDPFGLWLIETQYKKFFGPDESLTRLLSNTDPEKFDQLFGALSPEIKQFIKDLSPAEKLPQIKAKKIFVIHSDPDRIVPINESARLHQALSNSDLTILKSFSHVNVQFTRPTIKSIFKFYLPETLKLYRLIFRILN
ncbi:MAG: hypothetical protein HY397_03970 [Candidatus Doudnabacteria bacterium]|nr:hypothetical protein [Candidatus Doudnabacteria bacterium]